MCWPARVCGQGLGRGCEILLGPGSLLARSSPGPGSLPLQVTPALPSSDGSVHRDMIEEREPASTLLASVSDRIVFAVRWGCPDLSGRRLIRRLL